MKSISSRLVFVALVFMAGRSWAQAVPSKPGLQAAPIAAEEKSLIEKTIVSDQRVQRVVGAEKARIIVSEPLVDKAEAEAFISGATDKPPTRSVTVLVFNPKTNKAVHAVMSLEQRRVLEVEEIKPTEVPFTRDDADDALALAKANPEARRILGARLEQFVIVEPGSSARVPLAAQVLPLRSSNPNDPCSADRCLDLIFRTERGYLPLRVSVDLTKRSVSVNSRSQQAERPDK